MHSDVTPIDIKFLSLFKVVKLTISAENQLFYFPSDMFLLSLYRLMKRRDLISPFIQHRTQAYVHIMLILGSYKVIY